MKCPKCDTENPSDSKFCKECATPLPSSEEIPISPTKTLETPREELTRGTTFAGRYEIIEELGKGGMGKIYRVEDKKIKEEVALKLIIPEIASDKKTIERFSNELKMARKIRHKNVCGMYDLGEEKGTHYITMEYVSGEDLKSFIRRVGQLPAGKAISIAKQTCDGLAEAHKLGVVHRDLKPSNIMIDKEGNARIMDFGIARSLKAKGITGAGVMIGTPEYMSPEQAEVKEVDQRSDIYSLGVILYEMLTGRVPFEGETPLGIAMKHKSEIPKDPKKLNTQIADDLNRLILRCMEKKKEKRYQKVEELLSELSKIEVGKPKEEKIGEIKLEKSIVVLPFEDISPGKDNEYFSDGLTEEIITDLSKIHSLRVISRNSAMMLKGTRKATKTIGQELNVQYVLEGSVRKAGNNLRISAQLIDAKNDAHLWAEKYSGTLNDVFDIQEKVSRSIVDALKLKLSPEEDKRITDRTIDNVQVYEWYFKARQEITLQTEDGLERALQYLNHGINIVGDNALLHSCMGHVYFHYVNLGIKGEDYIGKAEECVKKAFELDPESPKGHVLLGIFNQVFRGNQQQSVLHFKRALDVDEYDPDALFWLGLGYAGYTGKTFAAIPLVDRLSQIDPLFPFSIWLLGVPHFFEGRYDLALVQWRKAYQIIPDSPLSKFFYAIVLAYNKCFEEAFAVINQSAEASPQHSYTQLGLFCKYAFQGNKTEALSYLSQELDTWLKRDGWYSWHVTVGYALLDMKQEALDWLENAANRGFINYPFLNERDPFLENIRGEERFKKLMERVKYEWEHFEV